MIPDLQTIFNHFKVEGTFRQGGPYGSGHINDTYRIRTRKDDPFDYILQRINHDIFNDIPGLQENIRCVTAHIRKKLETVEEANPDRQTLTLIPATGGKSYYHDRQTGYWRCYLFISDHRSYNRVETAPQAYEAGRAYGQFEKWLSDLDPSLLRAVIPRFHDMDLRLEQFHEALSADAANRAKSIKEEIHFVTGHAEEMTKIQRLGDRNLIPLRITHNDTKINNVLFDSTDRGLCVIDLDTVMPGYIHYDFGDAIRTSGNSCREDEQDLSRVSFNLDFFKAFSQGFLEETLEFLTEEEILHLAFSARVMTFIIGIRFLTDHLNGDTYFKIHHDNHNLHRARVQFQLIREMEEAAISMENIIQNIIGQLP